MAAAQRKTVLKVARKALLAAVASLPDAEALDRLTEWQEDEGPGLRRRALLAARIALMRRLLTVEAVEPAPPPPPPEPEPEPVIEAPPPPPPPPKPPKVMRTSMKTFSMEDAAKLLMSTAAAMEEPDEVDGAATPPADVPVVEDMPAAVAEPATEAGAEAAPETEFVAAPWIDMALQVNAAPEIAETPLPDPVDAPAEAVAIPLGTVEITDVDTAEAALDSLPEEDKRFDDPVPPRRAERVTPVLPMDIGAQLAAMAEENDGEALEALATFATAPKKAGLPPGLDDSLAALEGLGDLGGGKTAATKGARKTGKGKPVAVGDMGAQFAALDAVRDAEVVKGPAKPAITIDLSAQFAAMQDPDD